MLKLPLRWTATTASQSSSFMLKIMRSRRMPALLTTMLSLPKLSIAHSMIRLAALKSVTLSKLATASPPAARISLTTSSAGERDCPVPSKCPPRSLTTTLHPCFAINSASSRPIPRPAPVMTATFPSNSAIVLVPLCLRVRINGLLGDLARAYNVKGLLRLLQGGVGLCRHLIYQVDDEFRFVLVVRVHHQRGGPSLAMKVARPGFARGHDERRRDVEVVFLELILIELDHLI